MLNKGIAILIVLMLSACAHNMGQIPTAQTNQQQAPVQVPVYPLTSKEDIRLLQQRLKIQDFDPGPIDGILGEKTTSAIRQFQQVKGYPVDGEATTLVLQQLDPEYVPVVSSSTQPAYDDSIVGNTTVESAIGLGAIGAAAGAIFGGKEGALIGAASGVILGAGADAIANTNRVSQAKTEHNLNLSLDQIRQKNTQLKQSINRAKNLIEEDKRKLLQINEQVKNKSLSMEQAQQQLAELEQNKVILERAYNEALATKEEWKAYAGTNQDVDQEIEKLNEEIASLKIQLDELDQLRSISIAG